MSNYAKVGGILSIIAGVLGVIWLLGMAFLALAIQVAPPESFYNYNTPYYYSTPSSEEMKTFLSGLFLVMGLVPGALGALSILGGVFALGRKHWGWALAGAIGGIFLFFPLGVPATIFVSMGKREFGPAPLQGTPFAPAAPPGPPAS